MAQKKIEFIFDVDGKAIDVAIDKTLNLQQRAKALTAELRRTKEGTDEFRLLSKELGAAEDGLAKTNAKSKDLFTSLSALPGPVGDFFGQLSGSIELLKTFSSFTLKDLQFQLGEATDDIAEIGENLVGLNQAQEVNAAITEAQAAATGELAAAENIATTATEAQTVATEAQTVATQSAEVATIGLGTALKAIGIGLLIAGLAALIAYWDDIVDAINGATDVTKAFDEAQKDVTKNLTDFNLNLLQVRASFEGARKGTISKKDALKEYNEKLGKSVGFAGSLSQAEELLAANTKTVVESIKLRTQANVFYAKSAEAAAMAVTGEGLEPDVWQTIGDYIQSGGQALFFYNRQTESYIENLQKTNKNINLFAAEGDKLIQKAIENDLKLKKGLAEPPKDTAVTKVENQNQQLLEKSQKLQNDLTVIQTQGDLERQKLEIDNQAQTEIRELKALKITTENEKKRQEAIANVLKIAGQKKQELDDKKKEEDLKKEEDFNKKLEEIRIAAIDDETERTITARENKLKNDLADLEKDKEFIKKSEIEKSQIRKDLTIASENEINQIRLQKAKENADLLLQLKQFETEAEIELQIAKIDALSQLGNLVDAIAGKNKTLQVTALLIQQAAAVAEILARSAAAKAGATAAAAPFLANPLTAVVGAATLAKALTANQIATVTGLAGVAIAVGSGIAKISSAGGGSQGGGSSSANSASPNMGRNYEKGGLLNGPRHAQGGMMIEAEGGEAVMTRGAVTMFAPMLSMMNQMGGGTSFGPQLNVRPDAPVVDRPQLAQEPVIMKTYVVSNELTSESEKLARLKDLSTL